MRKGDQELQPHDGHDHDKEASAEHEHDHDLLSDTHLQTPQIRHWHGDDDEIQDYVAVRGDCQREVHAPELRISLLIKNLHCSGRHNLCIEIHASAFVLQVPSVPSKRDWLTLQDCDDKECDNVGDVQANRGKRQPSE
jgi:hypothetical protein